MKKYTTGIFLGAFAGLIDLIPMLTQNLSWDADLAAFSMWIVVGFLISSTGLKIRPIPKGIFIALLVLFPSAILIGSKNLFSLIPVIIMTILLGGFLGYAINKISARLKQL